MALNVISVQVLPISTDKDSTLLGFCVFTIDDSFTAGDIGLHFKEGKYYLLFPTKRLRNGFIHYFKPLTHAVREAMLKKAVDAYKDTLSDCDGEVINEAESQG